MVVVIRADASSATTVSTSSVGKTMSVISRMAMVQLDPSDQRLAARTVCSMMARVDPLRRPSCRAGADMAETREREREEKRREKRETGRCRSDAERR